MNRTRSPRHYPKKNTNPTRTQHTRVNLFEQRLPRETQNSIVICVLSRYTEISTPPQRQLHFSNFKGTVTKYTCIRTYMRTCIHTYIRTYVHAYIHACIHTYITRTHVHTNIHIYIHIYMYHLSIYVSIYLSLHIYIYTHMRSHPHAHTHAHIHPSVDVLLHRHVD